MLQIILNNYYLHNNARNDHLPRITTVFDVVSSVCDPDCTSASMLPLIQNAIQRKNRYCKQ